MGKGKNTILIVDDVELNRAILHDLFYPKFDVLEAADGAEAIKILDRKHDDISVVVLDIVMPGIDGFGVLKHATEKGYTERLPIFFITGESSADIINRGYDDGIVDLIQKPFNPTIIRRRVDNVIELYEQRFEMERLVKEQSNKILVQSAQIRRFNTFLIDTLSTAIEFRSCESGAHVRRIRGLTRIFMTELAERYPEYGITADMIEQVTAASALHDIGKIAIPDVILNKKGKLTPQEFEIMKTHTLRGFELIDRIEAINGDKTQRYYHDICRWHHEKWDGKGYPDKLVGDQIPIWAQATSLADCYDALVSERTYKEAIPHKQAIEMLLNGECGAFSPKLKKILIAVASRLPHAEKKEDAELKEFNLDAPMPDKTEATKVSDRTLALIENERAHYRNLMQLSNEILFIFHSDSKQIEESEHFIEVFGDNFCIKSFAELKKSKRAYHEDIDKLIAKMKALTKEKPSFSMEIRLLTPRKGDYEWFKLRIDTSWTDKGELVSYIGHLFSIDSFKKEILRWKDRANIDSLTGVLNRYGLTAAIDRLTDGETKKQRFALFMLDVDNFKQVNDTHGHTYGDKILKLVARIVKETMRNDDIVGRIGGDEFVFIMGNIESPEIAARKAKDVCDRIVAFSDRENIGISASIGIALYPRNGYTFRTLLEKADKALYTAKEAGKGTITFYTSAMDAKDYISMITMPDEEQD